jgi:hypothetical protein
MRTVTKGRALIGALLLMLAAGATTVAVATNVAVAQTKGTAQAPYLRLEWEFDSARGNYQNACGRVYNDREMPARHVTIVFDGYDAEGKKVSSRFGEVVGDVPARGYAIFCLLVKSGGARYQVSVPGVDWGPAGQ